MIFTLQVFLILQLNYLSFLATGVIEGVIKKKGYDLVALSAQNLLDCAYNLGCSAKQTDSYVEVGKSI